MRMVFIYIPSTAAIACATDRNMLQPIHVGEVCYRLTESLESVSAMLDKIVEGSF